MQFRFISQSSLSSDYHCTSPSLNISFILRTEFAPSVVALLLPSVVRAEHALAKQCYLCLAKNVIKLSKLNTLFIIFILILCAFKCGFRWLFVSSGWCFGCRCYRCCSSDCLFVCFSVCARACVFISLWGGFFLLILSLLFFFLLLLWLLFLVPWIVSAFHHLLRVFLHKFVAVFIHSLLETMTTLYHAHSFSPKYVLDYRFQFAVSS